MIQCLSMPSLSRPHLPSQLKTTTTPSFDVSTTASASESVFVYV